ncbi:MAG: hypothetical protein WAP23_01580 [Candidatus Spechtbacterales bacterium]
MRVKIWPMRLGGKLMISDLELAAKVEEAKKLPNSLELACIAIGSNSPTNAANIATDGGRPVSEQQYARWLRMALERGLRTNRGLLEEFFDDTHNKEGDTTMTTTAVDQKSEKTHNGFLGEPGAVLLAFGIVFLSIGSIGCMISLVRFFQIDNAASYVNVIYSAAACVAVLVLGSILAIFGAHRSRVGQPVSRLPNDEFTVIGAFGTKNNEIYVTVEGTIYDSSDHTSQRTALLAHSRHREIVGFPSRAIGPGEFRLRVEKRRQTLVTLGKTHRQTAQTYTFIPETQG